MNPRKPAVIPFGDVIEEERRTLRDIWKARSAGERYVKKKRHISIALSGGGIRSATFNLGVLQALAESGRLADVDYISSVSGGGYINAWLTGWCARHRFSEVIEKLKRAGGSPESAPVAYLRKYSNYLTPRLGLLSADSWTLESTYTRNLFLNMLILVLSLAGSLLVPRPALAVLRWSASLPGAVLLLGSFLLSILAVSVVAFNFATLPDARDMLRKKLFKDQPGVQFFVVVPVFLVSIVMSVWISGSPPDAVNSVFVAMLLGLVAYGTAWAVGWGVVIGLLKPAVRTTHMKKIREEKTRSLANIGGASLVLIVTGALGGALFYYTSAWLHGFYDSSDIQTYFLVSPVVLISVFALTVVFHIGLAGAGMTDDMREWWSRLGAWATIYSLGWIALWFTVFELPGLLAQLLEHTVISTGTLLAWVGSTVTGVMLGKGPDTGGKVPGGTKELAVKVAPPVFVLGFVALVSSGVRWSLLSLGSPAGGFGLYDIPLCAVLLLSSYALARRVDVNEFSMHAMYRNRLIRCYLGASRDSREPHPFTGLDPRDDMPLRGIITGSPQHVYDGPLPIFNTTLNISSTVRLDWQQRKARSFPFTPLGFGYQDSNIAFADAKKDLPVSLGTVMATSGAAVSPNMGFHTSSAVSFLLTLFNVRLGQWFFNPARFRQGDRVPRLSLFYLYYELFGLTRDTSRYVYLSDGGHFENLGLYELVRRGCEYIIASDASEDAGYRFGDLGNAIERCRVDLGVEITDLKTEEIRPDGKDGLSPGHWTVGKIRYKDRTGVIVYLKPSLAGDEPVDVKSYKAVNGAFPHQSTADQWFDELQFEAYRALGHHIGSTLPR